MKMEKRIEHRLKSEGIACMGFGIVGKAVMADASLTPEAKAIYAYLASFAGAGESSFPTRDKILSDLHLLQALPPINRLWLCERGAKKSRS